MASLRELLQRREQIRTTLHALFSKPDIDDPEGETRKAADALEAELTTLGEAERRQKLLDDLDRGKPGLPLGGDGPGAIELRVFDGLPTVPKPEKFDGLVLRDQNGAHRPVLEARHSLASFLPASESRAAELGLGGFLRALHHGPQTELERRVLAEAAIGSGGAMVPAPLAAEVIDLMRAQSVSFRAGARTIPMDSQTLKFARIISDPAGAWRNENAPIVSGEPVFDNLSLLARSWALMTPVSRELLEDASNLDAQLRAVFGASSALALDHAILYGSGTPPEPRGIANTAGIGNIDMGATAGGQLTNYARLLDGLLALDNANVMGPIAAVEAPRTARSIAGMVDTLGNPLGKPTRLNSVAEYVTTAASITETHGTANNSSSIIMGEFAQCFVGMRTALQISVLTERYADQGQVAYVLWLRADVQLAHPAAFVRISGITP